MATTSTEAAIHDRDFEAIEDAVKETARGRWFLEEYARRNRQADTSMLLAKLDGIEKSLKRGTAAPSIDIIRLDLADMAEAIKRTKSEIAQMKPSDDGGRFVEASLELDAIVEQTETATHEILSAAEHLLEIAFTLRESGADAEVCDTIEQHATQICMACSFQDLTGQRTRKVVSVLKYLEDRVISMTRIWGVEDAEVVAPSGATGDTRPDAHLLNGPQLAGRGNDQTAVDDMFDQIVVDDVFVPETPDMTADTGAVSSALVIGEDVIAEEIVAEVAAVEPIRDDIDFVEPDLLADVPPPPEPVIDPTAPIPEEEEAMLASADVFSFHPAVVAPEADAEAEAAEPAPVIEGEGAPADPSLLAEEPVLDLDAAPPAPQAEPLPAGAAALAEADVFAPAPPRPAAAATAPVVEVVGATVRVAAAETALAAAPVLEAVPVVARQPAEDPLARLSTAERLMLLG